MAQASEEETVYRRIETQSVRQRRKVPLKANRGLFDWMNLVNSGENLRGLAQLVPGKRFTMEEVRAHNKLDDAWMVLRGFVYNVTAYLEYHPGGVEELLRGVGRDCTELFDDVHAWVNIDGFLEKARLGQLAVPNSRSAPRLGSRNDTFHTAVLRRVDRYNYNTKLMHFELDEKLQLEPGQHVKCKASLGRRIATRPYTPINLPSNSDADDDIAPDHRMTLLVKVYADGEFTQYLDKLNPGDQLRFAPIPLHFALRSPPTAIGMIAGGTGIAPLFQIAQALLSRLPNLPVSLLFCNTSVQDILLKETLDSLCAAHSNFKAAYALTQPDELWNGERGRISGEMLRRHMPIGQPILICGPIFMINHSVTLLLQLGQPSSAIHEFV
jgi:NAD(P)H-flavin reductase